MWNIFQAQLEEDNVYVTPGTVTSVLISVDGFDSHQDGVTIYVGHSPSWVTASAKFPISRYSLATPASPLGRFLIFSVCERHPSFGLLLVLPLFSLQCARS